MADENLKREPPSIILAIDSGIGGGSLSVVREGSSIAGMSGDASVSRAEDLIPNIESLLASSDLQLDEIGLIAVSVGPGSFTGLRIGISTAKGLSAALDKPLVGVSLVEAIAARFSLSERFLIAVPMSKSDIYFQEVGDAGDGVARVGSLEDLAVSLRSNNVNTAAVHSDLIQSISELNLTDKVIDLGSNMAYYIGLHAPRVPAGESIEPLYVQNPRFR